MDENSQPEIPLPSEKHKLEWDELQQKCIFDGSVFISYKTGNELKHPITDTLSKCEAFNSSCPDAICFDLYEPEVEVLTLYECLHRLFLFIHLVLFFKQKEEDVPQLVEILKESEQILIRYAELLFEMNPYFMFLFTIFLNHETQKYETYDMYEEVYDELYDDPEWISLSGKPKWKEHFVGKNEEFIYVMRFYLQFIFSESFFQNQMKRCGGNRMENLLLRLILEYPSFLQYAVPESNFMTPKEIQERIQRKEYSEGNEYVHHLHPWISEHLFWIFRTNHGILFNPEMYLLVYANRRNKEFMDELYEIYKNHHPVFALLLHAYVRGEYETHGEEYKLSTEEDLAWTNVDLYTLLHQSDMNYSEEDVIGKKISQFYCLDIKHEIHNNLELCKNAHSMYDSFYLTKKLKETAHVGEPLYRTLSLLTNRYYMMREYIRVQFYQEKQYKREQNELLPFECPFPIDSISEPIDMHPPSYMSNVSISEWDEFYSLEEEMNEYLCEEFQLDPFPEKIEYNNTPIFLSNPFYSWRYKRVIPKVCFLPYPLLFELYHYENLILYDILSKKEPTGRMKSPLYLIRGIMKFNNKVYPSLFANKWFLEILQR